MSVIVTPSQTCGPLFGFAILPQGINRTIAVNDPQAIVIRGLITDGQGAHIDYQGFVEFWCEGQACRARTMAGQFEVVVRKPDALILPNGQRCAPHLNVAVHARGVTRHLVTRLYFPDDHEAQAVDPILSAVAAGRRHTLIARPDPDSRHLMFPIRLQGEEETVFFRHNAGD
ncbi:hypothetical protein [Neopusillimonas aromaticivorans]|uniref:hypothetical protein n=1 Tax=Neopusillimonas aromaticivorans TaxID=2979868 RepID=UPI00259AA33C|nr:hypothetical protein [Neopusillimonas aromaticivorans]WJJ94897.1 hypothetical protein N7E01_08640 [Neopusillimonas aromaticivorans]